MSTECVNVHGDVIINYENQDLAYMFESVESIFGSLIIYGTNLTSIDFLGKLEHIISLTEEQPALIVEMNSILSNVSFPSLQRVQSRAYVPVLFNNNSVSLVKDPSYCYDIRNSVTTSDTWIVKFDDQVCEDVEKAAAASVVKDKSTRGAHLQLFLITIVSIGVLFNF
ncbi:hypothetical protein GCK72_019573 [Caenorhabditis remanei]|uniref:Receptor L-domain domain-containing protein n=1 Tax=Caenorhabditis remanei TaxID=31234 RepID=A0A6A5GCN4_CAERE|nr:hypothetical protein GCK72_019573 [Caenorhabditis remanei]KAF1753017.1 hypothetical protein GCK72_019573 [Caenorhabditis remanei]